MKKLLAVSLGLLAVPILAMETAVTVVSTPDTTGTNAFYTGNRPPLQPSPLIELPMGAVRPEGWLRRQLELQNAGFHGHLTEISAYLRKAGNAWLEPSGKGTNGWEEVPYWLKGFQNCAFLLDDKKQLAEAREWIEGILRSQQPDGWLGPGDGRTGICTDLKGRDDLWPNMVALFCLQSFFEQTADARVVPAMTRYFKYLQGVSEEKFLTGYWPSMRGGDLLYSVYWLYNRTGESWLLELAQKVHRKTARWDTGVIDLHNVNVAQAFREPTVYWMQSGQPEHLAGAERNWQEIRKLSGQVPGGMFGADENARPGYNGPRQAIQTCGSTEEMLSEELLLGITGNPIWADRCETVAFNTYPAAFTADMKALRYLTAPNQPQSDQASKAPGVENGGNMFEMNPHDHRCCQHNCGHGWPYFTQHAWFAAPGNGLAAVLYAPCVVAARVGDGTEVRIAEETRYPFEDTVALKLTMAKPVKFPPSAPGSRLVHETGVDAQWSGSFRRYPARQLRPYRARVGPRRRVADSLSDGGTRSHLGKEPRHCRRRAWSADLFAQDQGRLPPQWRHRRLAGVRDSTRFTVELRLGYAGQVRDSAATVAGG